MPVLLPSLYKTILISNMGFNIEEKYVLRALRISKVRRYNEIENTQLKKDLNSATQRAYSLIQGRGIYKTLKIGHIDNNKIWFAEISTALKSSTLSRVLSNSSYASILVATIDSKLEEEVDRLIKKSASIGYLLDCIGGWMADYMAGKVDAFIQAEASKIGLKRTMRYSPGYGDFGLEHQTLLLEIAQAYRIGVSLTEGHMLIPQKSVSAIIGLEEFSANQKNV